MENQMYANDYNQTFLYENDDMSSRKVIKKVKKVSLEPVQEQKQDQQENQDQGAQQNPVDKEVSTFQQSNQQYTKKNIKARSQREEFKTKSFRNFQNAIKQIFINNYVSKYKQELSKCIPKDDQRLSILDLGCGKGGDLAKWGFNDIFYYTGIDPSQEQLIEAKSRFQFWKKQQKFNQQIKPRFICGSGSSPDILKNQYFDIISSQFVIHYMFDSEENAQNLFRNIGESLVDGGYFICIILDANILVKRLRQTATQKGDDFLFGNSFYRIKFNQIKFPKDKLYGISYGFYLEEAIGKKQLLNDEEQLLIYTEEYLVPDQALRALAEKNNLVIKKTQNLLDFYQEEKSQNEGLFKKVDAIEKELWDVSHLYKLVVMQKQGGQNPLFDRSLQFRRDSKKEVVFS